MKNSVEKAKYYAEKEDGLVALVRGELISFTTPAETNGELHPTDHNVLLKEVIYPLVSMRSADDVSKLLGDALASACRDALGVFCAIQCFYIQIVNERYGESPISIDRINLPRLLANKLADNADDVSRLRLNSYDPDGAPLLLAQGQVKLLENIDRIMFFNKAT